MSGGPFSSGCGASTSPRYAREWIVAIEDIWAFVAEHRQYVLAARPEQLLRPGEEIYPVRDAELARPLGLSREVVIQD